MDVELSHFMISSVKMFRFSFLCFLHLFYSFVSEIKYAYVKKKGNCKAIFHLHKNTKHNLFNKKKILFRESMNGIMKLSLIPFIHVLSHKEVR